MIAWALFILYLVGFLYTARHIAGRIAWEFGHPDGMDIAGGFIIGFLCALPWPLSLPIAILSEQGFDPGTKSADVLAKMMRKPLRVRAKEAARREADLQMRIRQLEREVGIK